MTAKLEFWLYVLQRATALILAPLVLAHLATIIYAVQRGLSADAILARTEGSAIWAGFYGVFVAAAAVHGSIGVRTVASEMLGRRGRDLDVAAVLCAVLLITLGFWAVGAVT